MLCFYLCSVDLAASSVIADKSRDCAKWNSVAASLKYALSTAARWRIFANFSGDNIAARFDFENSKYKVHNLAEENGVSS